MLSYGFILAEVALIQKTILKNRDLAKERSRVFFRRTIKEPAMTEGFGLHSGENTKLIFHPAEEGTGLRFFRAQGLEKSVPLLAHVSSVIDTSLAVTLGNDRFHIQTVEHLMYAIYILGITDLLIEIQGGSEIPILDGSAQTFIELFEASEFHDYSSEIAPLVITKPVMVVDGDRYIVGLPSRDFRISYSIDYKHPLLRNQSTETLFTRDYFANHIGRARTFGFLKDVEELRKKGLAMGGTTENVLVFTQDSTLNEERFLHEALYHKILDMLGDLSLTRRPIIGHLLGSKGGHALDIAFAKKLLREFGETVTKPESYAKPA